MTKAEETLRNNGIRPTKMRLFIYKYLKRKFYAVTLREIETAFVKKSKHTRDRTTIYRSIKLFQKKGILECLRQKVVIFSQMIQQTTAEVEAQ